MEFTEFKLDPHVHIDFNRIKNEWHGVPPKILAEALMKSGLDGIALTNHYRPSKRLPEFVDELARLQEIEKARTGVYRKILVLLGLEATVSYDDAICHIGHIFEGDFNENIRADIPGHTWDLDEFRAFTRQYPGMTILNHPAYGNKVWNKGEYTFEMTQLPEIKAVEILNGKIPGTRYPIELISSARIKRPNLGAIGGSDTHRGMQGFLGKIYTAVDVQKPIEEITREDVIVAMVQGKTKAVCRAGGTVGRIVKNSSQDYPHAEFLKIA